MAEKDFDKTGAPAAKVHKIRITLTSRNVKNLEKCKCRAPSARAVLAGRATSNELLRWTATKGL